MKAGGFTAGVHTSYQGFSSLCAHPFGDKCYVMCFVDSWHLQEVYQTSVSGAFLFISVWCLQLEGIDVSLEYSPVWSETAR